MRFISLCFVFITFSSASASSFDDFFRAVRVDNDLTVVNLLRRGFDPNTVNPDGQTALHLVMVDPAPRVTAVLLRLPELRINARNRAGETPLMLAALKGRTDLVRTLLARDGEVNHPGWTPLHYAAAGGHAEVVELLLSHYAYIDAASPNRTTPLMMAAGYGNSRTVRVLLEAGADATLRNEQGLLALDFALRSGARDSVGLLSPATSPVLAQGQSSPAEGAQAARSATSPGGRASAPTTTGGIMGLLGRLTGSPARPQPVAPQPETETRTDSRARSSSAPGWGTTTARGERPAIVPAPLNAGQVATRQPVDDLSWLGVVPPVASIPRPAPAASVPQSAPASVAAASAVATTVPTPAAVVAGPAAPVASSQRPVAVVILPAVSAASALAGATVPALGAASAPGSAASAAGRRAPSW